jgi:hypothetical protein
MKLTGITEKVNMSETWYVQLPSFSLNVGANFHDLIALGIARVYAKNISRNRYEE